jgi:hypothetical protein
MHVAAIGKGFLVSLPDAVNDRRMARIAGGAVIEFTAEVDNLHEQVLSSIFIPA